MLHLTIIVCDGGVIDARGTWLLIDHNSISFSCVYKSMDLYANQLDHVFCIIEGRYDYDIATYGIIFQGWNIARYVVFELIYRSILVQNNKRYKTHISYWLDAWTRVSADISRYRLIFKTLPSMEPIYSWSIYPLVGFHSSTICPNGFLYICPFGWWFMHNFMPKNVV